MATTPTHATIRYGSDKELRLEFSEGVLLAIGGTPRQPSLDDVVAAVQDALAEPIGYPGLGDATLESDRVCVVVNRDVPQTPLIVAGIVTTLTNAGLPPRQINILLAEDCQGFDDVRRCIAEQLSEPVGSAIQITKHNSHDPNGLAYLATTESGDSIMMNREICDADVVIPIGTAGVSDQKHGHVFPAFSDAASRDRHATPASTLTPEEQRKRTQNCDEAAWLLGARFTVQVVPGAGDSILQVIAGDIDAIADELKNAATEAWETSVPAPAALIVAAIEGGGQQQSWDSVAKAIDSALAVFDDSTDPSAIVVCTELDEMPSDAMTRAMIGAVDEFGDGTETESAEERFGSRLRETLSHTPVYLLSRLPEEVVLDLGLAFVDFAENINNLCRQFDSCIVLNNAQHVVPRMSSQTNSETAAVDAHK